MATELHSPIIGICSTIIRDGMPLTAPCRLLVVGQILLIGIENNHAGRSGYRCLALSCPPRLTAGAQGRRSGRSRRCCTTPFSSSRGGALLHPPTGRELTLEAAIFALQSCYVGARPGQQTLKLVQLNAARVQEQ